VMRRALSVCSITEAEARDEIRSRGLLRQFLAHMGDIHGEQFYGPEWIGMANDYMSRSSGKSPDDVLAGFATKFRISTGLDSGVAE